MSQTLDRAIALLTDGHPLDWEGLLEDAADARERSLLEELRGLAQLDTDRPAVAVSGISQTVGIRAPASSDSTRRWGHLELLDEIGRGAYGAVYRAWDTRLAREVALKLITAEEDGQSLEEARRLARISHPNVVSVYGADRIDGQVGLWMELLKGCTLDAVLAEQGPFSAREAIGIGLEICGAIAAIHAAGLIHRDIKAQNIVREPGGRLVLMDVGASLDLSRADAGVRSLAGTPLYMAPELFDGAPPSAGSDIYALGVLLYRLVSGEFPVHARTIGDVHRAHAEARLRPLREVRPELSPAFVDVVERCIAPEPTRRLKSAAGVERALHEIDLPDGRRPRESRRRLAWTLVAGFGLLTVGVAAGMYADRLTSFTDAGQAHAMTPELYRVFAGYEELAFTKRNDDPAAAAAATDGAFSQLRSAFSTDHPIFALLRARLSESWRRAGNLQQANIELLDGSHDAFESIGEDHPLTAVLAMERARNAQAAGDHHRTAVEVMRALEIRGRLLGLQDRLKGRGAWLTTDGLERASVRASCATDTDGDGLLDLIEVAAGLDPHSMDSDGNGILDDDEAYQGIPNRLALGLVAAPFLTWTQSGAYEPRFLGWQSPAALPMAERPARDSTLPAWFISASHSTGYITQRFSRAHSVHALQAGFSLIARVQPMAGLTSLAVDTSPVGPRFDMAVRRIDDRSIEIRLLSSVVPREGPSFVVPAPRGSPPPVLELRYRPQWRAASLFIDGKRVSEGYIGSHQFQDPKEGGVAWGVNSAGNGNRRAEAAFNLVWLEFF